MNKTLIFVILLFFAGTANAQNPFEKYGYTPKIATLSNGKYQEFHDQDRVVKIGEVLFDTKTKQIVGFVEEKTSLVSEKPKNNIATRWISPDPLAEEYPNVSPYNFVKSNPIIYVDPDGRSVEVSSVYNDGNEQEIRAFEAFALTDEGRKYIKEHAQEGFKLEGVYEKDLNISVEEAGEKHKKGVDVNFEVKDIERSRSGETETKVEDGKLTLSLRLSQGDNSSVFDKAETFAHEAFYHGDKYEKVFLSLSPSQRITENVQRGHGRAFHGLNLEDTRYYKVGVNYIQQLQKILGYDKIDSRNHIYYNIMLPSIGGYDIPKR